MEIEKKHDGDELVLIPSGMIDTSNANDFDKEIQESLDESKKLTIDFSKVSYISSSGLRALVKAQKKKGNDGSFTLINVSGSVKEVFNLTGFSEFLTIK